MASGSHESEKNTGMEPQLGGTQDEDTTKIFHIMGRDIHVSIDELRITVARYKYEHGEEMDKHADIKFRPMGNSNAVIFSVKIDDWEEETYENSFDDYQYYNSEGFPPPIETGLTILARHFNFLSITPMEQEGYLEYAIVLLTPKTTAAEPDSTS